MITNIDAYHKSAQAKSAQPHSLLAKWFLLEQATINSDLSSSAKSVLASLLFHHNTKTGRSFVGEDTIAAGKNTAHTGLRLSTRQVKRCIRELKEKEWIVAERRFNKSSEYEFNWSRAVPVDKKRQSNGDMDVPSVGDIAVTGRGHGCHPMGTLVSSNGDMDVPLTDIRTDIRTDKRTDSESVSRPTVVNKQEFTLSAKEGPYSAVGTNLSPENYLVPHSQEGSLAPVAPVKDMDESFDHFWSIFPRQEGKADSHREFISAVGSGVSPQTIIDKAGDYARKIAAEGTETRYIKLPSTWLRKKCWTDNYASTAAVKPFADEDAQYAPCPAGMRPDVWRGIQRAYKGKLTIN